MFQIYCDTLLFYDNCGMCGIALNYEIVEKLMPESKLSSITLFCFNPIRSRGGGFKSPPPPPIFCSHAFNFGATLLCVGDFSQKIV